MNKDNPYDLKYAGQTYYWGKTPSSLCNRVIEILKPSPDFRPKLLDLGCGEGRDVVYFAQHGFEVVGLDSSLPGLEKTQRYAEEVGVDVKTIHADIVNYRIEECFDVIFSTGTLHYLPPEVKHQVFQNYKDHTSPKGINAFTVFVKKPFIPKAPDSEATVFHYQSGELMAYYWDWEILFTSEDIFDCMFSGVPHKHAVNRVVTRRYRDDK